MNATTSAAAASPATAITALVTGASSGIGLEMARLLAGQNCNLVLVSRRGDELERVAAEGGADAIFHAAALADFRVERPRAERKIASRGGELILTLVPATKLLGQLRGLFPNAKIIGWKYELDDTREDALAMGRAQIFNCGTDACVVNGTAYGVGYGFLTGDGALIHFEGKPELCTWLANLL